MAEITADVSSYRPVQQPSPLDIVSKFQGIQSGQNQLEQQRIGIDQSKLKLMNEHFQIANQEMSVIANDPNITPEKAQERLAKFAKTVDMPPQVYQHMTSEFGAAKTPDEIRQVAKFALDRGMATQERINRTYGTPGGFSQGQQYQPTLQRTGEAPTAVGNPVQLQAPPTTPVVGANNEPRLLGPQAPQLPPGAAQSPGGIPGQFVNNRLPVQPSMKPPNASAAPMASGKDQSRLPVAEMTPRGPATGLAPGVTRGLEGEATESVRQSNDLAAAANEQPQAKALIGNLRNDLKYFTPGPGADYKRLAKSAALSNLPIPDSWKKEGSFFDPKSVASQEQFNKVAYNIMQSQFRALGGTGTNSQLDNVSHTSPNEFMSKMGIEGVVSMLEGNQDAIAVKNKEWLKWRSTHGVDSWPQFNAQFNSSFDPRVFQFKYMSQKERDDYTKNIDNDENKAKFAKDMYTAIARGWVNKSILDKKKD